MSQNNTSILDVGLDVAKASLPLDLAGHPHSLTHDPKGHAQLLKLLRDHPTAQSVCEATGGYEKAVGRILHAAQVPASVVEAGRVRHFAGGRAGVRCARSMATLSAVRYDAILKAFYLKRWAAGKKPKVALGACMRKLISLMNRLLKNPKFQLAN